MAVATADYKHFCYPSGFWKILTGTRDSTQHPHNTKRAIQLRNPQSLDTHHRDGRPHGPAHRTRTKRIHNRQCIPTPQRGRRIRRNPEYDIEDECKCRSRQRDIYSSPPITAEPDEGTPDSHSGGEHGCDDTSLFGGETDKLGEIGEGKENGHVAKEGKHDPEEDEAEGPPVEETEVERALVEGCNVFIAVFDEERSRRVDYQTDRCRDSKTPWQGDVSNARVHAEGKDKTAYSAAGCDESICYRPLFGKPLRDGGGCGDKEEAVADAVHDGLGEEDVPFLGGEGGS